MDPDGLEELSYYLRATLGMTLYVVLIDEWTCCCGAGRATLDDVRRLSFAIPFPQCYVWLAASQMRCNTHISAFHFGA